MAIFGKLMGCGAFCMKSFLGIILILALMAVHDLGLEWQKEVKDCSVHTVQDPEYWGPVTMLIPNNCTELDRLIAAHSSASPSSALRLIDIANQTHTVESASYTPLEYNWLGYVVLPSIDILQLTAFNVCNRTIEGLDVSRSQYYWSAMITASSGFDIEELHKCRMRFFWFFVFTTLLGFLQEWAMSSVKMVKALVNIDDGSKQSCCEKGCKFMIQQMISKLNTLVIQLTFVSLFVTFWDQDHYVMNYFPGRALIIIYFIAGSQQLVALVAVCMTGCSTDQKKVSEMCARLALENPIVMLVMGLQGLCSCICCIPVVLPCVGWSLYNVQFLWKLFFGTSTKQVVFAASFPSLQAIVGTASKHLIGINILDLIMTDLAECATDLAECAPVMAREREDTKVSLVSEPLLVDA